MSSKTDLNKYSEIRGERVITNWSDEVKQNVITETDIEIERDLAVELATIIPTLPFTNFYGLYDLITWPDYRCTNEIKRRLSIYNDHIYNYMIFRIKAGTVVKPHVDPVRETNLYLPIAPFKKYSPLEIYWNEKIYGLTEYQPKIYAWNSKRLHAVYNNEHDRFSLQASVNTPYKDFVTSTGLV